MSVDPRTTGAATVVPWRLADEHPTLCAGDLHVWRHDLDRSPSAGYAAAMLSEPELSHAARFAFERDRRRFCAGRVTLRQILSRYLHRRAETLPLAARSEGKPILADRDLEFNVSHSQNEWICAIGCGTPVGVDVETLKPVPDCLELARHHFTEVEASALAAVPETHRDLAFLTCWTRKEAYLKLLGFGILAHLDAFVAGVEPGDVTLVGDPAGEVLLRTFFPGPDSIGALAFMGHPRRIEYFVTSAVSMAKGWDAQ